ncbi:MAG: hypothetical protein EOM87_07650 [Clostridia bacterium]|nr:hypothetical protein [Clostridia bacterium]
MKTLKRIMCVFLLTVIGSEIGYLVYTGDRLASFPASETYTNKMFISSDGEIEIEFNNFSDAVYTKDGISVSISLTDYKDGILVFSGIEREYRFIALNETQVFDTERRKVLYGT